MKKTQLLLSLFILIFAAGFVAVFDAAAQTALSDAEIDALVFMREEEKLARDVYLTLYDLWGMPIFNNIASSESAHMEAVYSLLAIYGIDDPAAGMDVGEFTNPDLQALYDQLVAQGSLSLADALKVGGAIEEIDILDLEANLAQTLNGDIIAIYENLLQGSGNHLRAFSNILTQQTGETYIPQYMDQEAYDLILSSPMGNGYGASQGQNLDAGQGQGQVDGSTGNGGAQTTDQPVSGGMGNGRRGGRNN